MTNYKHICIMKRIMILCCLAAAAVTGSVSCEKSGETGYTGTNYIYLSSSSNSMFDTEDASIAVDVTLTTSLAEDLTLTFKVNGDEDGVITLEGNPVTIPAGQKTGSFTIKSAKIMSKTMSFSVSLDGQTVLPDKVAWKEDFSFSVNSADLAELTEEQKAIIEAYKEASGIDLSKYLGLVQVSAVYTASNPDSEIPLQPETFNGSTMIVLSDKSEAGKPVLKMTVNPMGIQDALYKKLASLTIGNPMWSEEVEEGVKTSYMLLTDAIGWTSSSNETFMMTLDGIEPQADKSVNFVADLSYYDEEWEEDVVLFKVPFEFSFSAYEREKKAVEDGVIVKDENWYHDATVNPDFMLNCDDISDDGYDCGNYVAASATISAEKMEFTFCIYNYNDYDYSKVVATYTPNK